MATAPHTPAATTGVVDADPVNTPAATTGVVDADPITALRQLHVTNVALLKYGANPEARIVLAKRRQRVRKGDDKPRTTSEVLADLEMQEEWWELYNAFMQSLCSIREHADAAQQAALMTQSIDEFAAAAKALLVKSGENPQGDPALTEVEKALRASVPQGIDAVVKAAEAMKGDTTMPTTEETLRADLVTAQRRITELEATVAKAARGGPGAGEEDIWKGVPEAVRKRVEDAEAKATVAEGIAKAERDRREEQECIAGMQVFKALPVNAREDWRVLKVIKSLTGTDAAAGERIMALLKAADELAQQGTLLTRAGHSGRSDAGSTAWDKIQTEAEVLKSKEPGLTTQQAIAKVAKVQPGLYSAYLAEQRR